MKMAKASQADLDMAMDVCGALDAISSHWPTMPGSEGDDYFDADNPEHCVRAIAHLIETMKRGSTVGIWPKLLNINVLFRKTVQQRMKCMCS